MDRFPNSATIMKENRVSFSVGNDGETKYWDGEQCEVVGEGTYDEVQEWMTSSSDSPRPEYEVDEQDLQIAWRCPRRILGWTESWQSVLVSSI